MNFPPLYKFGYKVLQNECTNVNFPAFIVKFCYEMLQNESINMNFLPSLDKFCSKCCRMSICERSGLTSDRNGLGII